MEELTTLTLDDFLDRLARRSPTPGGGAVAGVAGALACSLARMVAAYSIGKDTPAERRERIATVEEKLHKVDDVLRALITRDAIAYEQMATATRPGSAPPASAAQREEAILSALAVPIEMTAGCSTALGLMEDFAPIANRRLLSDLRIAAILALAAAESAGFTAGANLSELADVELRGRVESELGRILEHCRTLRESIDALVDQHLQ